MTQIEQTQHAKDFAEYWKDKGDEKQESQRYWIGLLGNVLGYTLCSSRFLFVCRRRRDFRS